VARPKEFDRKEVLEAAMDLFWIKGYAAASIQDLVDHLGIGKRSLYDTYGSKEDLFMEALDLYHSDTKETLKILSNGKSMREAIRELYFKRINFVSGPDGWRGCLMTNTAIELAPHDARVRSKIDQMLKDTENALYRAIRRGQKSEEFSKNLDARKTAVYLTQSVLGFNAFAKMSPGKRRLRETAEITLAVLDQP
jgi:TetR/AcrR family transcriptional repressor of nem operon